MSAHGKRYEEARAKIDRENLYTPAEAVKLLKELPDAKFDETVEAHFRLGLNVRHADQQLRGTLMLPHGTGKTVRVAVFAEGDKAREAEEAGADVVGAADLAAKIEGGFTDFDVAIATPDQMGNVGKLGRVLGPRGLMPNPKTGTVTFDVAKAVTDAKGGKLEYRTDRGANVHVSIGKKSFDEQSLLENYAALLEEIVRAKPASAKGRYIHQITLTTTMGPGVRVDPPASAGSSRSSSRRRPFRPRFSVHSPSPKKGGSQHQRQRTSRGGASEGAFRTLSEPASVRARPFQGGDRCRRVRRNESSQS